MLPPRIVRRLVIAPLVLVLCVALVAVSPLVLLVALLVDIAARGRFPNTRLVAFGTLFLFVEAFGLVAAFLLWVAAGFGVSMRSDRIQSMHYALLRSMLEWVYGAARSLLGFEIDIIDRPPRRLGPVLVFGRHAGPGNSLMVVGTLMRGFDRRPRIVMLDLLQLDPLFDTIGNRLPNRFISRDPTKRAQVVRGIESLARGMGDHDALVLFPEGRDFTPRQRRRAIARLRRKGHHEEAEKAERMKRVLPPRHSGVRAAVTGAPEADVVFVAHTVLEDLKSYRGLWSAIPLRRPIEGKYWRLGPHEVPDDEDELIDWLYDWFRRIDEWVAERRGAAPARAEL